MKKSTLFITAMAFATSSAFAQDLTSKKGEPILPEAGDYSIGIDATPFLNYFGNFIGGDGFNTAPSWNHVNGLQTIVGKYYVDANMAYRGILRIGMGSETQKAMIGDANVTTPPTYPNLPAMKEDVFKSGGSFIGLGGGLEWRRGKTRLQGFYGADAFIWSFGGKDTYTYGNALSTTVFANAGTTTDFGNNLTTDTYGNGARVLTEKFGRQTGFGLRGFVGAEYFFAPKISIAGEFGWGVGFYTQGAGSLEIESVGGTGPAPGKQTLETGKESGFLLDTDRNAFGTGATQFAPSGQLRLNFHF
ncbi:MAG: hypothetical protein ACRCYO_04465 [Bacteroidia bacterium]